MPKTVLELVQAACYETSIPAPSTLVNVTDVGTLQTLHLFYATGRELRQARCWPQLKKNYSVVIQSGRTQYYLPQDFYAGLTDTYWDQGNRWQMQGPMGDGQWNYRLYGYVTIENRKAFRIWGPDINQSSGRGQFLLNPTPGDTQAGILCTFEYLSKSWLLPPSWAPSTSYAQNDYVNSAGNIYKKTDSGSDTSGTVAPTVNYMGQGQDGGVYWTALTTPAWAGDTYYAASDFVLNSGNLYQCMTGGKSASSGGPTTTDESITDGTVTWQYCSVGSWEGETNVVFGSFINVGGQYYEATTPGVFSNNTQKSGKNQPNWTLSEQTDGTITWTVQPQAYETIISDDDLCVFDDELMIMGLKWRFLQAKGMGYQDLRAEYEVMKDAAVGRWNNGQRINFGGSGYVLAGLNPNIPEGNFTD